jgi:hypothetical protein
MWLALKGRETGPDPARAPAQAQSAATLPRQLQRPLLKFDGFLPRCSAGHTSIRAAFSMRELPVKSVMRNLSTACGARRRARPPIDENRTLHSFRRHKKCNKTLRMRTGAGELMNTTGSHVGR